MINITRRLIKANVLCGVSSSRSIYRLKYSSSICKLSGAHMSEVNGFLIFKLPTSILDKVGIEDECLSSSVIAEIIEVAGIKEPVDEKLVLLDLDLMCDGIEKRADLLLIYPFDEHFMDFAKLLAEYGKGIEFYGAIGHEAGVGGYYLLDAEGNRSLALLDFESEEDCDPEEIYARFLKSIPERIKDVFDDIFP